MYFSNLNKITDFQKNKKTDQTNVDRLEKMISVNFNALRSAQYKLNLLL